MGKGVTEIPEGIYGREKRKIALKFKAFLFMIMRSSPLLHIKFLQERFLGDFLKLSRRIKSMRSSWMISIFLIIFSG